MFGHDDPKNSTISDWSRVCQMMIENHRTNHPEESRTDREMILSLLEYFVTTGVVRKEGDKYILPKIANPQALIRQYSSHKN